MSSDSSFQRIAKFSVLHIQKELKCFAQPANQSMISQTWSSFHLFICLTSSTTQEKFLGRLIKEKYHTDFCTTLTLPYRLMAVQMFSTNSRSKFVHSIRCLTPPIRNYRIHMICFVAGKKLFLVRNEFMTLNSSLNELKSMELLSREVYKITWMRSSTVLCLSMTISFNSTNLQRWRRNWTRAFGNALFGSRQYQVLQSSPSPLADILGARLCSLVTLADSSNHNHWVSCWHFRPWLIHMLVESLECT